MTKAKLNEHITVGASPELRALVARAAQDQATNWSSYVRSALVRQLELDGYSLRDPSGASR
jgi:uncharacterized protein (DUF1778 family)